jgi:tetratricopeptide (TPR) repeat protein
MADSERALGRPDRALELVQSDEAKRLPRAAQIELRIVESGIRRDQGLADAAVLALQVPELADGRLRPWSARLFYAYGDALLAAGRPEAAREAFSRAVVADEDEQTDALARLDELDGITVEDLEDTDDNRDDLEDEDDSEDEEDLEDDEDEDEFAADDYPDDHDEDVGEGGEPDDLGEASDEDEEDPADRAEEFADETSEGNGNEPEVAAGDSLSSAHRCEDGMWLAKVDLLG